MFDVHCHVLKEFYKDPLKIIKESIKSGINVINTAIDIKTSKEILKYKEQLNKKKLNEKNNYYIAIGIHPDSNDYDKVDELKRLVKANKNLIIAIGEIGLDKKINIYLDKQIDLFIKEIQIALKFNKPIVVHSRGYEKEVLKILDEFNQQKKQLNVLIHCYTGKLKLIKEFLNLKNINCYFSIPSNVIINKQFQMNLEEIIRINKQRFVIETDSPFLDPFRNKKIKDMVNIKGIKEDIVDNNKEQLNKQDKPNNKPINVQYAYQYIKEKYNINAEEIDNNVKNLFNL